MIAWKTWREIRWLVLLYTALLELGVALAVLLWPWLRDQSPALARLAPARFIRRWIDGITDPDADAAYRAYMALQLFFKGVNVVGLAFAVLFGALLVARERENHTLEFLLARPLPRSRILLSKLAVVGTALVLPIVLTSWSAIPIGWLIDERLPFGPLTVGALYSALFCTAFLALATLLSVYSRTQLGVIATVGGFAVLQVGLYFVQQIRRASVFRLSDYDIYAPVLAGNLSAWQLLSGAGLCLLLFAAVCFWLALRGFRRLEP